MLGKRLNIIIVNFNRKYLFDAFELEKNFELTNFVVLRKNSLKLKSQN